MIGFILTVISFIVGSYFAIILFATIINVIAFPFKVLFGNKEEEAPKQEKEYYFRDYDHY